MDRRAGDLPPSCSRNTRRGGSLSATRLRQRRWASPEVCGTNDHAKREDLAMLICQCTAMHRRDVVCGGGAAVFSAIIATLLGSSKPAKAEAISGSVPELDGVAVRVVVDSYQFAVAPSRKLADVDIQHFG